MVIVYVDLYSSFEADFERFMCIYYICIQPRERED